MEQELQGVNTDDVLYADNASFQSMNENDSVQNVLYDNTVPKPLHVKNRGDYFRHMKASDKNIHCPCEMKTNTELNSLSMSDICVCSLKTKLSKYKGLKIVHINCRSLLPKLDELWWIANMVNLDIMCLSETWLDDTVLDADLAIDGFTLLRKDRQNRTGGGVAMYVKHDITFSDRPDLSTSDESEIVWVEIVTTQNCPNVLLACVYRPPNATNEYFECLVDSIEKASTEDKEMVITGDMNFAYVFDENLHSNPLFMIENLFSLTQLIKSPTRVTLTTSTLLDVILSSCPDNHSITGVHKSTFSDHYLIYTNLNISPKLKKHREIRFRNYNNFNIEACLNDFSTAYSKLSDILKVPMDLNNSNSSLMLDEYWQKWKDTFITISDTHAPFKTARLKSRRNNWVTSDIVKLMYNRDYLHKKAVKSKDPTRSNKTWQLYRKARNFVTLTIKNAKLRYNESMINQYRNKPKELWKHIKRVVPKESNVVLNEISPDVFNEYFATIGEEVAKNMEHPSQVYDATFPDSIYTFSFKDIENSFIEKVLRGLPEQSKNDILNFDTRLLSLTSHIIAPTLTLLLNISLKIGYCPDDWKLARVSPAFKGKGNPLQENNYRPLSVIAHLAKIMEKCVQIQLLEYLTLHRFISIDQFAYLKLHSTQMCLHRLIDDILENINDKEKTALCFLDIKKCFDTIDHNILLYKLQKYGIRNYELLWFKSYLVNRSQKVFHNGAESQKRSINIGVPQGTILGPILFLLYVNDLSNVVSNAQINIYADDVVIYSSNKCINQLQQSMQTTMTAVHKWYQYNKLSLSLDKCTTMVINNNLKNRVTDFKIYLGSEVLNHVYSMKYLGVVIDDKLKWTEHILNITKKININNARLRRTKRTLPQNIRLKVHNAISTPTLDYAATVWGSFSKTNSALIERLEHMSARAITGNYDFINARGAILMSELNMPTFEYRKQYYLSLLMFKAIHGLVPDYIANNIMFTYEITHRNLRSFDNMNLYKPKPNNEIFKQALCYSGPTQWNLLPLSVKEAVSTQSFKQLYKSTYKPHAI